jgi:hypothetical protein
MRGRHGYTVLSSCVRLRCAWGDRNTPTARKRLQLFSDTPPAKILVSSMRGSHELKLILDGV